MNGNADRFETAHIWRALISTVFSRTFRDSQKTIAIATQGVDSLKESFFNGPKIEGDDQSHLPSARN
jgi:hypothetical protein